jgi:hypothetical protein
VLLEGPAIEPLLAQVRQEYGPNARIISADKVRTGGLGGFFARERYELSVEVDDLVAEPAADTAADPPADPPASDTPVDGLLALVEAGQNRYRDLTARACGCVDEHVGPCPTDEATHDRPEAVVGTPRAGLVSTAHPAFAEVLAGLQGGLSGGKVDQTNGAPTVVTPAPPAAAAPRAADVVKAYRPATLTPDAPGTGPRVADLIGLGVPKAMADRSTDADPYRAALQALADLPTPPAASDRPGDVLVVAGELALALPVARQLAADLRLEPNALLLAGASVAGTGVHPSRRISGPADAERKARRLHRADVPHVVVVDVPATADDNGWVREVCDAVGASTVWAVVDATRKTADTARYLRTMGEVDAIAVHGLAATADPATPLALAEPIALLDGRPATPHAWAALLAERMQPLAPMPKARRRRGTTREVSA